MEQCTCQCKVCETKVEEPKEEKPKFEPHNIHFGNRSGFYAFKGQGKDEIVKLMQKADKQEKERLRTFADIKDTDKKTKLTYEDEGESVQPSWGMPQFKREPTRTPVDFDDDNDLGDEEHEGGDLFALQKLAGLNNLDMPTHKASISVKEKVVAVLGQKYFGKMRFEWTSDPESYLEQYLLVNDAKTKISVSPLVEIFEAVSKISDENDAMNMTCQVVVSKISSLFE